jgi:hypothetical protein
MIICKECGAEAAGGSTCPRCGASLPADRSARALALASAIIGAACGLGAAVLLVVDLSSDGRLSWSLVGLSSALLCWILVGFPMLTYRKPALFLSAMGAAVLGYLWLLDGQIGAAGRFAALALPIALAGMASGALSALLCLLARRRGPNVGAFVLFGCTTACIAVEAIVSLRYRGSVALSWSAIVAAAALPVAFLLLGLQARLRQPEAQAPLAEPAENSSIK